MADMVDPATVLQHMESENRGPVRKPKAKRPTGYRRPGAKVDMAQRRMKMAAMFADNATLADIGRKLGVSATTVSLEIDKFVRQLEAQALEHISRRISRSEAVFRSVQLEAHLAWIESQKAKKVEATKRVKEIRSGMARKYARRKQINEALDAAFGEDDLALTLDEGATPDNETQETLSRRETGPGDPRFLQIIVDCEKEIIRLRKLIPKDGEGGGAWGGGGEELRRLSVDERVKLLERMKEKAQLRMAQHLALNPARNPIEDAINVTPEVRLPDLIPRQPIPEVAHPPATESGGDEWLR